MSRLACVCVVLSTLIGCSGAPDDQPETGMVTGKVTLGGNPVSGAKVFFTPVDGGRTSEAVTQDDGSYELIYLRDIKGAKIGEHQVRITTFEQPEVLDDGTQAEGRPEAMPPEFSQGTELRTVEAGEQVIDFEIP